MPSCELWRNPVVLVDQPAISVECERPRLGRPDRIVPVLCGAPRPCRNVVGPRTAPKPGRAAGNHAWGAHRTAHITSTRAWDDGIKPASVAGRSPQHDPADPRARARRTEPSRRPDRTRNKLSRPMKAHPTMIRTTITFMVEGTAAETRAFRLATVSDGFECDRVAGPRDELAQAAPESG